MNSLIFAGSGHGGVVALKSLQEKFSSIEVISEDREVLSLLRESDRKIGSFLDSSIELAICAGYKSIIPKDILEQKTIINTHPSLLPKYRGLHSLVWAMLNFEDKLGFTIHLMNEYIDDGDILDQFTINYKNQTSYEIMQLFDRYIRENLGRVVKEFLEGKITPIRQNREEATWVAKRNIDDCIIDFNMSNRYIDMLFKALVRPYPLPIIKNNRLYEVNGYRLISRDYRANIGQVVNIEDKSIYIKVREGLLVVEKLIDFKTKESYFANEIFKMGDRLCR